MKKYKIGFVYLQVTNLGDLVIADTARYIVRRILDDNHINYELVEIDMGECRRDNYTKDPISFVRAVENGIYARTLKKQTETPDYKEKHPISFLRRERWEWMHSGAYAYYKKHESPKLDGLDLIIFCGGGLIKYHRQHFHFFIDDITSRAEKQGTPVLLNAVGVEGYEEKNILCQLLKNALNRKCVKYISTRDDYRSLVDNYVIRPDIITKAVCDPAFWTCETYGIQKDTVDKLIGLNVIRPKIFGEYIDAVDYDGLLNLYYRLIMKLVDAGYQIELFSNGVKGDTAFIRRLLQEHEELSSAHGVKMVVPGTAEELVRTISRYERFMAVRLHSSIIGTVMGIPNISLVWNRKQPLFGKAVGKEENYIDMDHATPEELFERLINATAYQMNEDYKNSVSFELEKAIVPLLQTE